MKILKIADYQPHKVDSLLAGNKEYKKLGTSDRKVCSRKKNRSHIFNDGMIYRELIEITGLSSRKSMENTSYQIRKAVEKKLEVEQFIDGYQDYGYWINPIWWT